jgi:hypothetical protein
MSRALILLALAACNPTLTQQTVAPPGRSARLDSVDGFWGTRSYRLEVSNGVAVALSCYRGGPCEHMQATSDDPAIAEVRPASLSALHPYAQQPAAAFVIVGRAPGKTTVRVSAAEGKRRIEVTVLAPPRTVTADLATEAAAHAE